MLTKIFPNPSQNNINIEFDNNSRSNYTLVVNNNLGQIVFEKIIPKDEKTISIDIKDFADGIYTYIITNNSGNNFLSGKFIKTK